MPPDDPALEPTALAHWLCTHVPGWVSTAITARRIGDGFSNLTYRVRGAAVHEELVLRRAPVGVQASRGAHDMLREYRVLRAVDGSAVPVPTPIAECADERVIGAPFYVMRYVDGVVLRRVSDAPALAQPDALRALGHAAMDTLSALHSIDATTLPIYDATRVQGYGVRQLRMFRERFAASTDDALLAERGAWLFDWLDERVQPAQRVCVIHNDFKIDNLLVNPDAPWQVRAVLDWEMATVGDPLFDLGMTLGYWLEDGDPPAARKVAFPIGVGANALSREAAVARYAAATGLRVDTAWCLVLGFVRVAVIGLQLHAGWRRGTLPDPRFEALGALADALVAHAETTARTH
jgi:aminoglycoside phosphotransferase (APT) family kinase protein